MDCLFVDVQMRVVHIESGSCAGDLKLGKVVRSVAFEGLKYSPVALVRPRGRVADACVPEVLIPSYAICIAAHGSRDRVHRPKIYKLLIVASFEMVEVCVS